VSDSAERARAQKNGGGDGEKKRRRVSHAHRVRITHLSIYGRCVRARVFLSLSLSSFRSSPYDDETRRRREGRALLSRKRKGVVDEEGQRKKGAVYAIDEDDDENARPPGGKITRTYRKKEKNRTPREIKNKKNPHRISFSLQFRGGPPIFFLLARSNN
jgi:hypothetical protein